MSVRRCRGTRRRRLPGGAPYFSLTLSRRFVLEPLESRLLLSVLAPGIPTWISEGPGPIQNGQEQNIPGSNPVSGAVEAVAADPTNANRVFVATANGGVWRTTNATAASPSWTPLTDRFPCLGMGDIEFSPLDPTHNTLFAGTANLSSGFADGSVPDGLLRTIDGGDTWAQLAQSDLAGVNIWKVMPTSMTVGGSQVILVGAVNSPRVPGALWRSMDGGNHFTMLSGATGSGLPAGPVTDIAADPTNPERYYVGVLGWGIFRSDPGSAGATWTSVNSNISTLVKDTTDIELGVSSNGAVWAATFDPACSGFFRSTNNGGIWSSLDIPGQTEVINGTPQFFPVFECALGLVADPSNANVAFFASGGPQPVGAPFPNSVGATGYDGRAWRIDASQPSGSQDTNVVANGANHTDPHGDGRGAAFAADGSVLWGCDGGIFRLVNPANAATRTWVSANGNITPTEFYSIAYDSRNNIIFGGAQDTGSPQQNSAGSNTWSDVVQSDGAEVAVDATSTPGSTLRYSCNPGLSFFTRQTYDSSNTLTASVGVSLLVNGAGAAGSQNTIFGVEKCTLGASSVLPFFIPFVLNANNPARMIIGSGNFLYESFDGGDHLNVLGAPSLINLNSDGVDNDGDGVADEGNEFAIRASANVGAVNSFVSSTPIVYGGFSGGVRNDDVLWVGTGGQLRLRTSGSGLPAIVAAYPGATVLDIAVDPTDWHTAYVLDGNGSVWQTTDSGATWNSVTGNLSSRFSGLTSSVRCLEFYRSGSTRVLLAGGDGGVFRCIGPGVGSTSWSEYGTGLPNVIVRDMHYDPTDDVLVVGTAGRGAWEIPSVSATIGVGGMVTFTGSGGDDIYHVFRDGSLLKVDETLGGAPTTHYVFEYDAVTGLLINTLAGNDSLIVDAVGGDPVPAGGITYDGGTDTAGDSFTLLGSAFGDIIHEANAVFSINGSLDIVALNVEHDAINGGAGNDLIEVDSANIPNTIGGGDGDDSIILALPSQTLDSVSAPINVSSDPGNDEIVLWDAHDAFADTYTFGPGTISRPAFGGLTYAFGIESVIFHGGPLGDVYNVNGLLVGSALTLVAGAGADTFNLSPSAHDYANNAGAALTVDGGNGADTLTVNDQATAFDANWTITSTTVLKSNAIAAPLVTYSNLEGLTLDGGNGGTTYTIQSCSTPLMLNTGGGDDEVDVGTSGAGNLDLITAAVSVDGGTGASNNLFIDDTADPNSNTWGLGFNAVTRSRFGGLSFADFSSVIVDAGSGGSGSTGSMFNVNAVSTRLSIFAGSKQDTFNIGNGVTLAAPLFATLSIDGGGGADALNLLDQTQTLDTAYTITASQITRGGSSPILYANLESVTIRGGSGNDTFTVASTASGAPVSLFGGAGSDTFSITPAGMLDALLSDVSVDGETGTSDQMTLSDLAYAGVLGQAFYTVTASAVQGTFTPAIHYANLDGLTLNTSNVISDVNLTGTAAGTPATINGDAGADILTVAGAGLNSDVTYDGGDPTTSPGDSLVVNGGGLAGSYTPSGTTPGSGVVSVASHLINFRNLEPVTATSFSAFTLVTPNSADSIAIASGPSGNVISGASGGVPFESLTWSTVTAFVLDTGTNDGVAGGSPSDAVTIQSPGLSLPAGNTFLFKGGVGTDKLTINAGSYTFEQDAQLYTASLSLIANSGASVHVTASQHLAALILNGGTANVAAGGGRQINTPLLSISGGGLLDLANNQLLISNTAFTPAATIRSYLLSAFAGGDWSGHSGITSSNAAANPVNITIGYADGNDLSSQDARPDIAAGTLLVRPTLVGDANLDGRVDFFDITQVLGYKYNAGVAASYTDGDLDYSGTVDFFDIATLLSANYNTGTTFPSAAPAAAAPSSLASQSGPPAVTQPASTRKRRNWHPW
jgi:hypothetical protein